MKITNGDLVNISAVISVALTHLVHYYNPSDYPLAIGYSLQRPDDEKANDFVLLSPLFEDDKSGAELIVSQRQKCWRSWRAAPPALARFRLHYQQIARKTCSRCNLAFVPMTVMPSSGLNARF